MSGAGVDRRGLRPGIAWLMVAAALAGAALLGWRAPRSTIDWQPALVGSEPWRAFSAIGVHYSGAHLFANLGGAALTGALGAAARVPTRLAWAWLAAWPLTQLGLLVQPGLQHYGGLSGVLHAGVACVIAALLIDGTRAQRGVGLVLAIGLIAKLCSEAPWGTPLRTSPHWDFAVAPLAHLTGAIAGAVCGAICGAVCGAMALLARRSRPTSNTASHG